MCRSPKKLDRMSDVQCEGVVKGDVLSINMNIRSSPQRVLRPRYPFRGKLGDQEKDRSPKMLKSLIEVPYVANLKVQVVSFNMSSQTELSILGKIWRSGKGSFTEKAKIVDRGSISSVPENTGSKPQYEPFLFSVACSQTELPISG